MVPSIVEFENLGDTERVTNHAKNIARNMGKATSAVRQWTYVPQVVEVYRLADKKGPSKARGKQATDDGHEN